MKSIETLRKDVLAGVILFLVALPLSLGIAQACGLPPVLGLFTGVIGGLVVTVLSPSRFSVSGPAAGLVTIMIGASETLGSFSLLLVAIVMAGLIQIFLACIRAGRWVTMVPGSVINGMLVAIGLLLISQQIPTALGYQETTEMGDAVGMNAWFSPVTVIIALSSLFLLFIWETKMVKRVGWLHAIPAPLMVVIWGLGMMFVGDRWFPSSVSDVVRVTLPSFENFDAFTAQFVAPDWRNALTNTSVYMIAITIALVASLETLLSLEALKKLKPQNPDPSANKELYAQGVGNTLSGLLGCLPITAVIVRSSVNVNANAQTKLSILVHGVLLFVCALFFSNLMSKIPMACLAVILLHTGYKLAAPKIFFMQWSKGKHAFISFMVTVAGIMVFGMLSGIAIGLGAQMIFSLYKSQRNAILLNGYDDHYVLSFQKSLTFMHAPRLKEILDQIPEDSVVIVEHHQQENLEPEVKTVLEDFYRTSSDRRVTLHNWPVST